MKVWNNGTDKVWCNDDKNIQDCCALKFKLPTKAGRYELRLWKGGVAQIGHNNRLCKNESFNLFENEVDVRAEGSLDYYSNRLIRLAKEKKDLDPVDTAFLTGWLTKQGVVVMCSGFTLLNPFKQFFTIRTVCSRDQ